MNDTHACVRRGRPWLVLLPLLAASCTPTPSPAPGPHRVDQLLDRLASYGYSGTIAVADRGRPAFEGAYGFADAERRLPMSIDARFDIGSLTKPFAAALVLKLQEDGVLSTGDSLGGLLPDVPPDKAGITVHQLLTHSSGLVRTAASLGVTEASTRAEFLAAVMDSPLLFAPGERFEYSDTGYDLLAAIVERLAGRPWPELLHERVLRPAGLRVTGYATEQPDATAADSVGPMAWSYAPPLGVPWPERDRPWAPSWFNRGSGGLVSTAKELRAWMQALLDGKVLSVGSLGSMTAPQITLDDGRSYGYGWFITDTDHGRLVYHGGDIAGYKAHLAYYADEDLIFAVLHSVYGWERVTNRHAIAAWFGTGPTLPPAVTDAADLSGVAGTYRVDDEVMIAWPEAGRLAVEASGQLLVDAVFAAAGTGADERTRDARTVVEALERGDLATVQARLRDRDLAAGLGRRMLGIWSFLADRYGPVDEWTVLGSQPAQDGTVVSMVRTRRGDRTDLMRFVWRGEALVAVGGDEGLRRPTATFVPVGPGRAARFEPATGRTALLSFEPAADPERVSIGADDEPLIAVRDRMNVVPPPDRSLVRALLPLIVESGVGAGLREYERLVADDSDPAETGEDALNALGYALLHMGAADSAVELFRYVAERYPDSSNAWDSLGEAQLAAGDTVGGRQSYAESLRLNPENETARRVVGAEEGEEQGETVGGDRPD